MTQKILETWHMGTHPRERYSTESTQLELSNEYHLWPDLNGFRKIFEKPSVLEESSLRIGRVKQNRC